MYPPPIFSFLPKPIKPLDQPQPHLVINKESTTATMEEVQVVEGEDYFDLLPDPIVSVILNNLHDAKSLCRCLLVSKRIASLVPQVHSVSVLANPTALSSNLSLASPPPPPKKSSSPRSFLKSLLSKLLLHKSSSKKAAPPPPNFIGPADLSNWISNSVNNFPEIRHLRVELPDNGGVVGFPDPGGLLKWSAEFGSELQRCAIIGATSFEKPSCCTDEDGKKADPDQNSDNNNRDLLTDEELRARVVWILSCLISACARHGVARKTVLECGDLRSAEMVDAVKQGRLRMSEDQIREMREAKKDLKSEEPVWKRTTVPNVIVKLWYAPELVLPESGYVMKGATVVAIRPDTGKAEEAAVVVEREYELLRGGFGGEVAEEEVISEAVREIVKSKWKLMYKLQMNSF